MTVDKMTIRIGGAAGYGVEFSGVGLCKALASGGLYAFGLPDYYWSHGRCELAPADRRRTGADHVYLRDLRFAGILVSLRAPRPASTS